MSKVHANPPARWARLIGLLCLGCLAVMSSSRSVYAQDPVVPDLEVIILVDESYSMFRDIPGGVNSGTDPDGRRIDAVELLLNTLAVQGDSADTRVAIVTFGTEATQLEAGKNAGPPAKILGSGFIDLQSPDARDQLLRELRAEYESLRELANNHEIGGFTDVKAALELARNLQAEHQRGHKPVVVLLTDGRPETAAINQKVYNYATSPEVENFFQGIEDYVAENFNTIGYEGSLCPGAKGTPIYSFAIRSASHIGDFTEREEQLWLAIANATGGKFTPPQAFSDDGVFQRYLQGIFISLLREWLCLQVGDPTEHTASSEAPSSFTFAVNDLYNELILNIAKDNPGINVSIVDAAGHDVALDGSAGGIYDTERLISGNGLSETWRIPHPDNRDGWSGDWAVTLAGGTGNVTFTPIYISDTRITVVQPPNGTLPVGAQIVVEVSVTNQNGEPISDASLAQSTIIIQDAQGNPIETIENPEVSDGRIWAILSALAQAGNYEIIIRPPNQEQRETINVDKAPWVNILSPRFDAVIDQGQPIPLEAQVMLGDAAYTPPDGASVEVSTGLYDASHQTRQGEYGLSQPDDNSPVYTGELPANLSPGDYILEYYLTIRRIGRPAILAPYRSVKFHVQALAATPTPTATALPVAPTLAVPTPAIIPTRLPDIPPTPTDIPLWLFLLVGGGIIGLILLLALFRRVQNHPVRALGYLEDQSGAGNDLTIRPGFMGRGISHIIRDNDNERLAEIHITPASSGDQVELRWLREGFRFLHRGRPIEPGQQFILGHEDMMQVGDVNLLYQNEGEPEEESPDSSGSDAQPPVTNVGR